ncbi:hypothetical protein TBLA_0D02460 [Henningerozyma blattae CBS 6284]|uniref:DUF726 domain protein n=1 Tax=Henningerozyma blattae (strain ATCC 34711 / CBS 6284 / DSM 70876 / NBRC 10599 / NRRL Y-10934 / UCD 77-7) TaxID=1071380 RepID=I2H2Z8_HENB6|nr:hypothetical protein TBLA_0D02460 [Tetrapisispora blattae CBS 6284]CCH60750.1 hypothetical protein TBLA_0D02460 [Tetrapisispora blattae CBS 6284]
MSDLEEDLGVQLKGFSISNNGESRFRRNKKNQLSSLDDHNDLGSDLGSFLNKEPSSINNDADLGLGIYHASTTPSSMNINTNTNRNNSSTSKKSDTHNYTGSLDGDLGDVRDLSSLTMNNFSTSNSITFKKATTFSSTPSKEVLALPDDDSIDSNGLTHNFNTNKEIPTNRSIIGLDHQDKQDHSHSFQEKHDEELKKLDNSSHVIKTEASALNNTKINTLESINLHVTSYKSTKNNISIQVQDNLSELQKDGVSPIDVEPTNDNQKPDSDSDSDSDSGWQNMETIASYNVYNQKGELEIKNYKDTLKEQEEEQVQVEANKKMAGFSYTKVGGESQAQRSFTSNRKTDFLFNHKALQKLNADRSIKDDVELSTSETDSEFYDEYEDDIAPNDYLTTSNQLNVTKTLLNDKEKLAYAGSINVLANQMCADLAKVCLCVDIKSHKKLARRLQFAQKDIASWKLDILSRLYEHLDVPEEDVQVIEKLSLHGIRLEDLCKCLKTTQNVENPLNKDDTDDLDDIDEESTSLSKTNSKDNENNEINNDNDKTNNDYKDKNQKGNKTTIHPTDKAGTDISPVHSNKIANKTLEAINVGSNDVANKTLESINTTERFIETQTETSASKISDETGDIADWRISALGGSIIPETSSSNISPKPVAQQSLFESNPFADSSSPLSGNEHDNNDTRNPFSDSNALVKKIDGPVDESSDTKSTTYSDFHAAVPTTVIDPANVMDQNEINIDVAWTIICDLFLILLQKSVYDSRSRTLLIKFAKVLNISKMEINEFEKRITDSLDMEQSTEEQQWNELKHMKDRRKENRRKKMMYVGLAMVGGSLVLGLSGGLLAPVIGAGVAAGLSTIGITGASSFITGAGGTAIVAVTSTAIGANIGRKGMKRRMGSVRTFEFRPLHNNRRVNLIVTVSGWMIGNEDDVRLPFSTVDPVEGDLYSLLWEPEMLKSTGQTINIVATEVFTQAIQQVLGATILTAFMAAIQWPLALSKLGYIIDNPWNVSLDRAWAAGLILADTLISKNLGQRPITLIGFSLGSRVIFSCLVELCRKKAMGLVENVILFGTPTVRNKQHLVMARSAVSGRFINGYSDKDWVLAYLFRATAGGFSAVMGISPIDNIEGIENFNCTELVDGHMAYRKNMPKLLKELGIAVTSEEFAEIEESMDPNEIQKQRKLVHDVDAAQQKLLKKGKKRNSWLPTWMKPKKTKWQTMVEEAVEEANDTDLNGESVTSNEPKTSEDKDESQKKNDPAIVDHSALMIEVQRIKAAMHEDLLRHEAELRKNQEATLSPAVANLDNGNMNSTNTTTGVNIKQTITTDQISEQEVVTPNPNFSLDSNSKSTTIVQLGTNSTMSSPHIQSPNHFQLMGAGRPILPKDDDMYMRRKDVKYEFPDDI